MGRMPILRCVPSALSTALLEWILMMLLFIDGVYSFLVTRFARLCRLPAPCPFCSRLDHVLGNEKPCFYRELICKTHKSEISSLAFCRLHQKLAGAQSMCEGCCDKANGDGKTDEPVMDVNVFDSNQGKDDVLSSPRTRICSCCGQNFKQQTARLLSRNMAEPEPIEAVGSPKIYTDYSVACHVDEFLEPKDIYHQSDHTSHERDSVVQMTSDSEIEVPCADDGKSSHPHGANAVEEDLHEDEAFELPDTPSPQVVKESGRNAHNEPIVIDSRDTSLACPVADDHPDRRIDGDQMEQKDSLSTKWASQHDPALVTEDSSLKDADASQIPVASSGELLQVLGEIEPCHSTNESNIDPYTTQFTIVEQHYAVSGERNIIDNLEQVHGPEMTATSSGEYLQRSANDPDDSRDIHVSKVCSDTETIGEVEDYTKKIEPIGDRGTDELAAQDPSNNAPKDFIYKDHVDEGHISAAAVRSSGEVPQDHSVIEEHPKTCEPTGERRPSLSTQISMNEAYKLAIGSKSSLPSPTLIDVILGKESTTNVNEELKLLLSQLSTSRGLEAPWVDPGPSPHAYGRGDELVVQNITKRISLERNASGLESLDGSIVSEMEGESAIDRLRRQVDLDRKSIYLLCRELEEERNASAIATSQALAMITKLQDEKAAMQMEASHYQRMMEEQAEYDNEALAKANELLAEREQQIEELEAELEIYRRQSGGGPIQTQANKVPFKEENIETALHGESCPFSLMSFEEERAYIAYCLRKLEQKLQSYSNNTSVHLSSSDAIQDDLSSKVSVVENDSLHRQESSEGTEEHISLGKEAGSSTMSGDFDLTTVQDEIASLNRRLKTLEGDHNFLEHSINSLRNGNEGLMFIREIACNLRELRAIAIGKK